MHRLRILLEVFASKSSQKLTLPDANIFRRSRISLYSSDHRDDAVVKLYELYLRELSTVMKTAATTRQFDGNISHIKSLLDGMDTIRGVMQRKETLRQELQTVLDQVRALEGSVSTAIVDSSAATSTANAIVTTTTPTQTVDTTTTTPSQAKEPRSVTIADPPTVAPTKATKKSSWLKKFGTKIRKTFKAAGEVGSSK